MILWPTTALFFLALGALQGLGRERASLPGFLPDLDSILVILVALFARKSHVTSLLVLLILARASLSGASLAAVSASFLAVGWGLAASRHLLFRDRLPGRLILGFAGALGLRGCLGLLAHLGRGAPLPGALSLAGVSGMTALWFVALLPLLSRLPPICFHLERSRV